MNPSSSEQADIPLDPAVEDLAHELLITEMMGTFVFVPASVLEWNRIGEPLKTHFRAKARAILGKQ